MVSGGVKPRWNEPLGVLGDLPVSLVLLVARLAFQGQHVARHNDLDVLLLEGPPRTGLLVNPGRTAEVGLRRR